MGNYDIKRRAIYEKSWLFKMPITLYLGSLQVLCVSWWPAFLQSRDFRCSHCYYKFVEFRPLNNNNWIFAFWAEFSLIFENAGYCFDRGAFGNCKENGGCPAWLRCVPPGSFWWVLSVQSGKSLDYSVTYNLVFPHLLVVQNIKMVTFLYF